MPLDRISDFSSHNALEQVGNDEGCSGLANHFSNSSSADVDSESRSALLSSYDYSEKIDELDFVCSCSMDSIRAGGSILIPTGHRGIILQLLERFKLNLTSENMKVPIFVVSSVTEELMAFTSIILGWFMQTMARSSLLWTILVRSYGDVERWSFTCLPPFIQLNYCSFMVRLVVDILWDREIWQEPCIVFFPRWRNDISRLYIDNSRLYIDIDLARQLQYTTLEERNVDISRLKRKLMVEQARYKLCVEREHRQTRLVLHFGKIDTNSLMLDLQKMGMDATVEVKDDGGSHNASMIRVWRRSTVVVEVTEAQTLISQAAHGILYCV